MTADDAPEAGGGVVRERLFKWKAAARFIPDLARLLVDVMRDPRVSLTSKLIAGATVVYVVSPIDLVPDIVPIVGRLDDVAVVALALRRLFESAGHDLLRELWRGTDDGFIALTVLGGFDR